MSKHPSLSPTKKKASNNSTSTTDQLGALSEHQIQRQQLERELNRMESVLRQGLRTSVASHCILGNKNAAAAGDESSVSLLSLDDESTTLGKKKGNKKQTASNTSTIIQREGILEDLMRKNQYSSMVIPKASSTLTTPALHTQKKHSSERDLRQYIMTNGTLMENTILEESGDATTTAFQPRPRSQSPALATKHGHRRYATTDTNFVIPPPSATIVDRQRWPLEGMPLPLSKESEEDTTNGPPPLSPSKFLRGRSIRSFKATSQSARSLTPPGGGGGGTAAMPPKSPHLRRKLSRSPVPPTRQQGQRKTTATTSNSTTTRRSPSPTTPSRGRHRTKSPHQHAGSGGGHSRRKHGSSSKSRDPDGKEKHTTTTAANGGVSTPSRSPTRPTTPSTNEHRRRLVKLLSAPLVTSAAATIHDNDDDDASATPSTTPTNKHQLDTSPARAFHSTRKMNETPNHHHRSNNRYVNDHDEENCGFVAGARSISLSPAPTKKSSITNDFNFGDSLSMDDYWAQATTTLKSADATAENKESGSTHRRRHHHNNHHHRRARSKSQGRDEKSTTSRRMERERDRERERANTTTPPRRNLRKLVRSSSSSRRHIQKSTALLLDVFQVPDLTVKEQGKQG